MGAERVYGLHTVRTLLTRAPQRVRKLWLQQGREDPRVAQLEALARMAQRPLERVEAARLRGGCGGAGDRAAWLGFMF
jgi:23S rRNA (guanosine2251-2'-O)-methyltransferase